MNKLLLTSVLFLIPSLASAAFVNNLSYGATGQEVIELQEFLTEQGVYSGPVTGNFYSLTLTGVKRFQEKEGIVPISGYFGVLSRTKANEILSREVVESEDVAVTPPPQKETIESLLKQVALLQEQMRQLQEAQVTATQAQSGILQSQSVILGAISENTVKPIQEIKVPQKEVDGTLKCLTHGSGTECHIYLGYTVDGKSQETNYELSSTDTEARFTVDYKNYSNPLITSEDDARYFPSKAATSTITVKSGGAEKTIEAPGQVPLCDGQRVYERKYRSFCADGINPTGTE